MQDIKRLKYLLELNAAKGCTKAELEELYTLITATTNEELHALLDAQYALIPEDMLVKDIDWESMYNNIIQTKAETGKVISIKRWRFIKIAAAAAVIVTVLTTAYFVIFSENKTKKDIATVQQVTKDVPPPDRYRAAITLADGKVVYLDSAGNGLLAQQGDMQLVKLANGQIAYRSASGEIIKELKYNTLTNPRGTKVINMALADGSHVWLNAGSSVTFPVAFVGNERKVEMTGEAYFEVAPDKTKPFYVSKGNMKVEVLGTHFNVNAYEDEDNIKVTLLEGSVKVANNANAVTIKPGQQAIIHHSRPTGSSGRASFIINNSVDVEQVMAWKEGRFSFSSVDIQTIMRQVARWYNVDIEYRGHIQGTVSGEVSREVNVSQVLRMLELTDKVRFEIQGQKIIVMPQ